MSEGRFIVFEGGEGAGKSTQMMAVSDWLRVRGEQVLCTREPGGSPLAEAIRQLILDDWPEGTDAMTELLLVFAARAAHLHARIRPALAGGIHVLCDRFIDATYAYQGAGRGVDRRTIDLLRDIVVGGLQPDQVIVLDIPEDVGLRRVQQRGQGNRFEAEDLRFQGKVRDAYLDRARAEPARYAIIDATLPPAQITRQISEIVEKLL